MNRKVIVSIGVILLLAIVALGVFTFNLSRELDSLRQERAVEQPSLSPPNMPDIFRDIDPFKDNWNPFEEMQRMQNEMNKIFGDMRSQLQRHPGLDSWNDNMTFSPDMDLKEENDRFVITVDIPGADESNINVKLDDNQLTITAATKKSSQQGNKNDRGGILRSERFFGEFNRSITLPSPVVAEKMQTDYNNGVLTITVPKK